MHIGWEIVLILNYQFSRYNTRIKGDARTSRTLYMRIRAEPDYPLVKKGLVTIYTDFRLSPAPF